MAVKTPSNGLRSLELYYEPIQNRDFGSSVAYRSILRINDPNMGVLLPSDYLPVSSRSARGVKLSLWALETAVGDAARLKQKGAYCEWLSAYVPTRLLFREDFIETLRSLLEENQLEPKLFCVELPEELLNEDAHTAAERLGQLRALGVRTMLSSFGGPFSPVMRLADFRLDFLYLDESVVRDLTGGVDAKIAGAISVFELVDSLEMAAVATGVATAEQESALPENCVLFTGRQAGRTKKITAIRS